MKKIYFCLVILFAAFSQAQTVIEDFENGIPSTWATFETGTGVNQSWYGNTNLLFTCQGNGCAFLNRENVPDGSFAVDWLVSPLITVPANGKLFFATKSLQSNNQGSMYSVKVSTTSQTDPNSFTTVASWDEMTLTTTANSCEQKEINLNAYVGQNIYLAFVMENDNGDRWIIDYITKDLNYHFRAIAFIDYNNNGVKDSNEPNCRNGAFQVSINNGITTNYSGPAGSVYLYTENLTDLYDISFNINSEYSSYYSSSLNYNDVSVATLVNNANLYFPINVFNPFSDVQVYLSPYQPPSPGYNYGNSIFYRNNGYLVENGVIEFIKPSNVSIISINDTNAVQNLTGFTLNYSNLQSQESKQLRVIMSVPTIPTVQIDDILTSSATINTTNTDVFPNNNTSVANKAIVAAYDPNDKHENHGPTIIKDNFTNEDYLVYTIRFQNTGNANTSIVRVEDFLDTKLNPSTVRMIDASHDYILSMQNNHLVWKFDPIYLTPQSVSDANSQGYITFKVKPNSGYQVGDIIPNTASIYFDMNPAIVTNTFQTEFIAVLSNESFTADSITIYPNPSNDFINIEVGQNESNIESLTITDVLGKKVYQSKFQNKINLSNLNQGVYFLTLTSNDNQKVVKRIIKE